MLGNHADQIMNTPMKTSVTTQANRDGIEMPAPRPTSRASMLPGLGNQEMLPGMGDMEMLPGMGEYVSAPSYAGTSGILADPKRMVMFGGLAFAAYWFLIRDSGGASRKSRRKAGRSRRASRGGKREARRA